MRKIAVLFLIFEILWSNNAVADDALFVAWKEIEQNYIERTSNEDLAIIALKSLNKLDNNIQVANDASRVTLYYNTKVFKNLNKPSSDNIGDWKHLVDRAVALFSQVSDSLVLKDYEIQDVMLEAMVASLDVDSKYHTAFDLVDEKAFSKKRYFASRMIGEILYVRMAGFSDDVVEKFADVLKKETVAKGLILDLRGNKGGSLDAVVKIGNMLLDGGVMFESKGRDASMNLLYEATKGDDFVEKPIIVLVDANTASSAEILAGVLQEQSRAKLMGTATYGKATSQKVVTLPNDSILMLTNAHLNLPSEKSFARVGLRPDYCLSTVKKNDVWQKSLNCPKEDRLDNDADIDEAIKVLEMQI